MFNLFVFPGLSQGTFVGLSALKELYLSHNRIENLQLEHFLGLEELESLLLDNNQLKFVNEKVYKMKD